MAKDSFVGLCALCVFVACMVACDREAPTRAQLENLIRQGATRDEVARQLGTGYTLYERNTELWKSLERHWAAEDEETLRDLHAKAERYPKVMFWTTAWTTTFVFLDAKDIARAYYQGSQ